MSTSNKQVERDERGRLKPGSTANLNGRPPKGYSITEMMREMLNNKPEIKESIGAVVAAKAMEGDLNAVKMIWEYMDGKPQQAVDVTSQGKQIGAAAAIAEVESKLKK